MRLDISELLREPGKHVSYDVAEPPLVDEDLECTSPIEGTLHFTNTGGTLLVKGKVGTTVALPCSRCGLYFEQPARINIDEHFELRRTSTGPRSPQVVTVIEEDPSPVAERLFDGHTFLLTELLRQTILLDEPTRPVPPVTPAGVCARCHKTPEKALKDAIGGGAEDEESINPALRSLGRLLDEG